MMLHSIHSRSVAQRRLLQSHQSPDLIFKRHAAFRCAAVTGQRLGSISQDVALQQLPREESVAAGPLEVATDRDALPVVQQLTVTHTDELTRHMAKRRAERRREQWVYQVSAIAATCGVTALAVGATYYRYIRHMESPDLPFPWLDMACTLALVAGGVFGMEMWARWAHRVLWHDLPGGWALHKSHHEPRVGPFEANDIFAIVNAVPAMGLCLYGFLTPNLSGSICFGAGLGITLFGIMYMFVHDGMVHKRFPVGPIADMPAMKRVAVAHRLHHSEKYGGVPWGMFFGPQELEAIGAGPELDRLVEELEMKSSSSSPATTGSGSGSGSTTSSSS